jgi:hypothetical protein
MTETKQPVIIDREIYDHLSPLDQLVAEIAAKNGKIIIREKATA